MRRDLSAEHVEAGVSRCKQTALQGKRSMRLRTDQSRVQSGKRRRVLAGRGLHTKHNKESDVSAPHLPYVVVSAGAAVARSLTVFERHPQDESVAQLRHTGWVGGIVQIDASGERHTERQSGCGGQSGLRPAQQQRRFERKAGIDLAERQQQRRRGSND